VPFSVSLVDFSFPSHDGKQPRMDEAAEIFDGSPVISKIKL
jgi:hypothetical protein